MPNSKTIRLFCLATTLILANFVSSTTANDKIEQALRNYEAKMEVERAKVIAAFEKEKRIAARNRDAAQTRWLSNTQKAWMDNQLIISERGGVQYFTGAQEEFSVSDFQLTNFKRSNGRLLANDGKATVRMNKPARALYFKAMVESKNNFSIQLNQSGVVMEKDLAIIVGGWNNKKSEIHFDGETLASKPVGMPPRWLCEVYYENQNICVYANGLELMKAKVPRAIQINLASISVSHNSATTVHLPTFKVK